jgi:hypothetical protein
MSEEKEQHIDGKDAGWPENIMQPQPAEQETDAEYQDRLTRELVARQKVIQKPAEQSVEIGKDGMCGCSAADKCPLGKTGSEPRCTIAELDKAEQSASGPDVWLTEELIKKNSRGMSSTELLDFCAEFEARVRQDERKRIMKASFSKTPVLFSTAYTMELEQQLAASKTQLEQMDDERLSWKTEAEQRGKALAAARALQKEVLDRLNNLSIAECYGNTGYNANVGIEIEKLKAKLEESTQ